MKYFVWIVILALLAAGGYYLYVNPSILQGPSVESAGEVEGAQTEAHEHGTFAELVALGGNQECRVSMSEGEASSAGTVYISGTDIRGDFTSHILEQAVESHFIQTGGYIYAWSDLAPQGMKMAVATGTEADTAAEASAGFDPDMGVEYSCADWVPNTQMFVLPTAVTFVEPPTGK